jgi:regulator of protease activity HflC (stomatin/prohibitin superfamily)
MNIPRFTVTRDENPAAVRQNRGHFRFNTISAVLILIFLVAGLAVQSQSAFNPDPLELAYFMAGVLAAAGLLFALPYWPVVLAIVAGLSASSVVVFGSSASIVSGVLSLGFLLAPGFDVIKQWDKAVILRLGKFHRVKGPGVIFLFPLLDTIAGTVDTRIRVTDFSAEKSLTIDTVPVHVDALAFWMIWDAEKAILEVQNFEQAVVLSSQTALRSSIGSNTLTSLLCERERLGEEIQKLVDAKTNPWGITIISVEFKEILVPKELEDALSRQAQAEREREARIILGSAEADIADSFRIAAETYKDNPIALQLRAMNMIYESIRNKGGLVLAPASALETMNLGTVLGTAAYGSGTGVTPDILPGKMGQTETRAPDAGEGE